MDSKIMEKDIIDYLIGNWDRLMPNGVHFFRKEFSWLDNWRCDITAYKIINLKKISKKYKRQCYKMPLFIEVKYQSNSRDLIYELNKALTYCKRSSLPRHVAVLSDSFNDKTINKFIVDNNIKTLRIDIKNNDLSTLKIVPFKLHK